VVVNKWVSLKLKSSTGRHFVLALNLENHSIPFKSTTYVNKSQSDISSQGAHGSKADPDGNDRIFASIAIGI
jgi:hypothetical protein